MHQEPAQHHTGIIGNHRGPGHPAHVPTESLHKQDIKDDIDRIQNDLKDEDSPAVTHRKQPAQHAILHQCRRGCPDADIKIIPRCRLDRRCWRNQCHGQFDDRPLQHHNCYACHDRNQRRTGKNRPHPVGVASAIGLCCKTRGRHAQKAKAPEHIGKDKRTNRHSPDIVRTIEMPDHSRVHRAKQRDCCIG